MRKSRDQQISNYINSQSRNKVILHKDDIPQCISGDVGQMLAQTINNWKDIRKLSIKVSLELEKIMTGFITVHPLYGKILPITNIGILLEPELKQDFPKLLEKHSNNIPLFVQFQGEIEAGQLFFISREKGIKIDISNISHITI